MLTPATSSQSAVVTRRLRARAAQVWDVMATPGAVARYHPFCSENPVAAWPGVGAQDTIHYLSGLVLYRRFTAWEEGRGYELEIGNADWPVTRVQWKLLETGAEETELTISIWPGSIVNRPRGLRWVLQRWFLLPLLRRYLAAVLRGIDHFVTTGQDVAPNQFGRLWLFSYHPTRILGSAARERSSLRRL